MLEILHDWNPWWSRKNSVDRFAGKERPKYLAPLLDLIDKKHVISVVGIRRCGKTTLLYQVIKHLLQTHNPENIIYLNMDDERLVGLEQPLEMLLQEYKRSTETNGKKTYIFLDEVQIKLTACNNAAEFFFNFGNLGLAGQIAPFPGIDIQVK